MFLHTSAVGLRRCNLMSAIEFAAAGKMAQRVNMRAHMAAHRQRFRRGTTAIRHHVVTMHLGQAEKKRWMNGVMRHTYEIRLRQIVELGMLDQVEQGLSFCFHS